MNVECRQEIWFKKIVFFLLFSLIPYSHLRYVSIMNAIHLCRWLVSVLYLLNSKAYAVSSQLSIEKQKIIMIVMHLFSARPIVQQDLKHFFPLLLLLSITFYRFDHCWMIYSIKMNKRNRISIFCPCSILLALHVDRIIYRD